MKNLDIDSENTNISIDPGQRVKIEFTGGFPSEIVQSRAAVYTVIVPYSSFSKKLQTIHRSGGKITNISVPRFQLDLPKVNLAVELDEDTMPTLEEIPETIPTNISEIAISTPKHEEAIAETAEIIPEPVVEIMPEPISEITLEVVSELADKISADQEIQNIPHIVEISSEHVADNTVENELKAPVANNFEEAVPVPKVEPKIESATPLAKSKKSKTSSKSGSGFNKPKSYT
jgi:hypothetical protein